MLCSTPLNGSQKPNRVNLTSPTINRVTLCVSAACCLLALLYAFVLFNARLNIDTLLSNWYLLFVGIFGATIANASGTGGGVVFLPVFNAMNESGQFALSQANILAASFLIQCFGMTMGAIVWCKNLYKPNTQSISISTSDFWNSAGLILLLAIPTMLLTQYWVSIDPFWVLFAFKIFSICLGIAVVVSTLKNANQPNNTLKTQISSQDMRILLCLAPIGGFANALFSVGLGEIIALFLFVRGYCITTSSGLAVFISSISVLIGAPFHIFAGNVPWTIIAITAPGALIGGFIARKIALSLGAFKLKLLAGGWIAISGILLLFFKVS